MRELTVARGTPRYPKIDQYIFSFEAVVDIGFLVRLECSHFEGGDGLALLDVGARRIFAGLFQ
jgi:hypothetical protein